MERKMIKEESIIRQLGVLEKFILFNDSYNKDPEFTNSKEILVITDQEEIDGWKDFLLSVNLDLSNIHDRTTRVKKKGYKQVLSITWLGYVVHFVIK